MALSTYISFFAGSGALDLSVRIAFPSARCIGYVENEVSAAEALASNIASGALEDAPIWSDVRTFPSRRYRGRVAGVVAGFPCPDYSVAGKRAGIIGKHGQLWDDLRRCIQDVQPNFLFLENVRGLYTAPGRRFSCICGWSDRWGGFPDCSGGREPRITDSGGGCDDGGESGGSDKRPLLALRGIGDPPIASSAKRGSNVALADVGVVAGLRSQAVVAISSSEEASSANLPATAFKGVAQLPGEPKGNAGTSGGIPEGKG